MALGLEDIRSLFSVHGRQTYGGEPISQLEHALQTAHLAESEGAQRELVVASFLHDIGHMLGEERRDKDARTDDTDDLHQYVALPFLRGVFSDAVLEPIGLHVEAKRCLCAIDPLYFAKLSPVSVKTLQLQGGIYSDAEVAAFRARPFAEDALRLRAWDDRAKRPGASTPDFDHYFSMVSDLYRESVG